MKRKSFWAGSETTYGTAATSWWPFPITSMNVEEIPNDKGRGVVYQVELRFPFLYTPYIQTMLSMACGDDGIFGSYSLRNASKWGYEQVTGAVPVSFSVTGEAGSGVYLDGVINFIAKARSVNETSWTAPSGSDVQWDRIVSQARHVAFMVDDKVGGGIPFRPRSFDFTIECANPLIGPTDWDGGISFVRSRMDTMSASMTIDSTQDNRGVFNLGQKQFKIVVMPSRPSHFYVGVGTQVLSGPFVVQTNDGENHAITNGDPVFIRSLDNTVQWGAFATGVTNPLTGGYTLNAETRAGVSTMGYGSTDNWVWYNRGFMVVVDKFRVGGSIVPGDMAPDVIELNGSSDPLATISTVY